MRTINSNMTNEEIINEVLDRLAPAGNDWHEHDLITECLSAMLDNQYRVEALERQLDKIRNIVVEPSK